MFSGGEKRQQDRDEGEDEEEEDGVVGHLCDFMGFHSITSEQQITCGTRSVSM